MLRTAEGHVRSRQAGRQRVVVGEWKGGLQSAELMGGWGGNLPLMFILRDANISPVSLQERRATHSLSEQVTSRSLANPPPLSQSLSALLSTIMVMPPGLILIR